MTSMIRLPGQGGYVILFTSAESVRDAAVARHRNQALGAEITEAALEVRALSRVLGEGDRAAVSLGGFVVAASAA